MSTCDKGESLSRSKNIDEECLHGTSASSPELKILFDVFKGTQLDDETYLRNFVESLKRRPCWSWIQHFIVEQTVFHFLCKDIPPPSVSTLTEADIIYAVNRLHSLFVGRSDYNDYKRQIKNLMVHDNTGNEVPVLNFRSFKDGRTALENAQCLKKTPGDKYDKVIEIIKSIDPTERARPGPTLAQTEKLEEKGEGEGDGTWIDRPSIESAGPTYVREQRQDLCEDTDHKYKVGDKLVLHNGTSFIVSNCVPGGYEEKINDGVTHTTKTHPFESIKRKAAFRGGKKTKRSSFRYKKRSSKSKKLRKRNKR
jgi:hypothetical protein